MLMDLLIMTIITTSIMFLIIKCYVEAKYHNFRMPGYKLDDYVITSDHFVGKIVKITMVRTRDMFWKEINTKIDYDISNSINTVSYKESGIIRKLSEVEYAAYLATCDQEKKSRRSVSSIFCQESQVANQPVLNSVSYPDGFPPEKIILGDK